MDKTLTAAQIAKLSHNKAIDSRITVKADWTFGNLVLVDGIPLTACGQGWSQWCTLKNGCFVMQTTNASGSHALACDVNITPAHRLMAHWMGFVSNQKNPRVLAGGGVAVLFDEADVRPNAAEEQRLINAMLAKGGKS